MNQKKSINLKRTWTQKEDDTLKRLYPNMSMSRLQHALNRGKYAIKGRAEILGLKRSAAYQEKIGRLKHLFVEGRTPWNKSEDRINKRWTDEDKKQLILLKEKGYTSQDIAKRLGKSSPAIRLKICELGLAKNRKKNTHPPIADRPHGWNMRPEEATIFYQRMAAITAVEQALNRLASNRHNIYESTGVNR